MNNILSNPVWNGVAAIIAILSLGVTIWLERERLESFSQRLLFGLSALAIGIFVIGLGYIIHPLLWDIFEEGGTSAVARWNSALSNFGGAIFLIALQRGLIPGAITATVVLSGQTFRARTRRGIVAAIVTIILLDIASIDIGDSFGYIVFLIVGDIIGGIIAGYTIGVLLEILQPYLSASN